MRKDNKRRDSKGRILRTGEQQRQDGKFMYAYRGRDNKMHYVYSWKLEPTDKLPAGKRECKALRELEKEIEKSLNEEVAYHGGDVTVLGLAERYISLKTGVRHNTAAGYKTVLNLLKRDIFGSKRIDEVKVSDAKEWLIKLQQGGKHYSSIHTIRGVLRPAFRMAVEDDLLKKNPFDWELSTVIVNDSVKREAVTPKQERLFLDFIKGDKHYSQYYEGVYILFKTGMRISEFCGLTLDDIDMENRKIKIDHQLQRTREGVYLIEDTKTTYGERILPMSEGVYQCFQKLIKKRKKWKVEPMVDGKAGFLVLDKNGMPYLALHWEKRFEYALGKYNRIFKEELPIITPHICRHTYCTNMAKAGISPKSLQYLMGHSDIATTLGYYTHYKFNDVEKEVRELERRLSGE
ncbi:MAG: tyrosine-type recombinase/integrase [Lachnospiraceae bacterium]|nr:tyrosine-type recombinase/integrase [Lachnospiraceae bacterium]